MGTPRFHRRKQSTPGSNQSLIGDSDCESYMSNSTSTDSEKKSWFKDVWNSVNQETQYSIIMDEQNPQKVKNQLIQVYFLFTPSSTSPYPHLTPTHPSLTLNLPPVQNMEFDFRYFFRYRI